MNAARLETIVNTKATGLLLAAAALLLAFIYFVERPMRNAARMPPDHRVFPELDPAKIDAVEVQVGGGARLIRAGKTNQVWQLTKPGPYPASGALIEKLLQEVGNGIGNRSLTTPIPGRNTGCSRTRSPSCSRKTAGNAP